MSPKDEEALEQRVFDTLREKAPLRLRELCAALGITNSTADAKKKQLVRNVLRRNAEYKWSYDGGGRSSMRERPKVQCEGGLWSLWVPPVPPPPEPGSLDYDETKKVLLEHRTKEKDVGVFVDAGWGDRRGGYAYLVMVGGTCLKPEVKLRGDVVAKLREEGFLGGNMLITFKARKFYPVLLEGEPDHSTLGDRLHRG